MLEQHHHLAFTVIVCVLIAAAAYFFFASRVLSEVFPEGPHVAITDTYSDGIHHIKGTVPVPSSCTEVAVESDIRADTLVLLFVPRPAATQGGICTQATTELPFTSEVDGPTVEYYLADIAGTIVPVRTF